MTDSPSQLALREVRTDLSSPKGLIALLGVGVLLGIAGPFGTFDSLPLMGRLLYWIAIVATTYAAGGLVNAYLFYRGGIWLETSPIRLPLTGILTGAAVMVVIVAINTLAFGWIYKTAGALVVQYGLVTVVSTIITGLLMLLAPYPDAQPTAAPLLDRLPLEKRGALVSLSVQDHYVQVVTTKGTDMLLMRLSDAIRETAPVDGLQVHRSHWVATAQVAKVTRKGDRAILTLRAGDPIPASRSYIAALRDAGLLVKSANG